MIITQAFAFLFDGANWAGVNGAPGILQRLGEHFLVTLVSVLVVVLIAVPLGFLIGHTGKGRGVAVVVSNIARALPTLGLLSILILLMGIGLVPDVIVFVILGIPPMLAGVYAGVESVDKQVVDASRAQGMTEWQIVSQVEWPLAAPLVLGGLRSTVLQVFATATIAATYAFGGLGRYIIDGIATANYVQLVAGSLLVTGVALILEGVLATIQHVSGPRGMPRAAVRRQRPSPIIAAPTSQSSA